MRAAIWKLQEAKSGEIFEKIMMPPPGTGLHYNEEWLSTSNANQSACFDHIFKTRIFLFNNGHGLLAHPVYLNPEPDAGYKTSTRFYSGISVWMC